MNDEDQELKAIFRRGMESLHHTPPDFNRMMEAVEKDSPMTRWAVLRMAASLVFVALACLFYRQLNENEKPEQFSLLEWQAPTLTLTAGAFTDEIAPELNTWSSPTASLLNNLTH